MSTIKSLHARQILDSRGNPTIEVEMRTTDGLFRAAVPSGMTTGSYEAHELRDGKKAFAGEGVLKAVYNVNEVIAPKVKGIDCTKQDHIDQLLCKLDGTPTKSRLGANAILAVSLACAKAAAESKQIPLYMYINVLLGLKQKIMIPTPYFNVINGSKHGGNTLAVQEFFIIPQRSDYHKSLQIGAEVYHTLKNIIQQRFGSSSVGDEGGFAPPLKRTQDALDLLQQTIKKAGYERKVRLGLDCAASEFYKNGTYTIDGKKLSAEKLLNYYLQLIKKYNLISIEDPFEENDFQSFALLKQKSKIQIVGDDLTVTNVTRIGKAIEYDSCNCLLLKLNQIGTLTEALDAVRLAYKNNWRVMVSHRSGETEDTFIADLAVGIGCGMIKAGAPCRGERVAKYNQLLRIEEEL